MARRRARRRLQDELDQRSAELIALRKAAVEEQAAAPGLLSAPLQSALGRWGAGTQVRSWAGSLQALGKPAEWRTSRQRIKSVCMAGR